MIGINDLYQAEDSAYLPSLNHFIEGYQQIYNEEKESVRKEVNNWLLKYTKTIDLATFVQAKDSTFLADSFDCGDGLHFSAKEGERIGMFLAEKLFPTIKEIEKRHKQ
ncbi:hypothetical protein MYY11_002809 [Enterococcus faecium]|nr:hypothetical protein [Enterococcus faecium]